MSNFRCLRSASVVQQRESRKTMHKNKRNDYNKGSRKRKGDEYDLQTILDEDTVNDVDVVEPAAAARNAETNDDGVRFSKDFATGIFFH